MSDTIVRVKRDTPLAPSPLALERHRWMEYAQIEHRGPGAFDVTQLHRWLHPVQWTGNHVIGHAVYAELARDHLLSRCLGLHELQAIYEKGDAFFHAYFDKCLVFGWKTRVMDARRYAYVPCLFQEKRHDKKIAIKRIFIKWWCMSQYVEHDMPTLLLPKDDGKVPL